MLKGIIQYFNAKSLSIPYKWKDKINAWGGELEKEERQVRKKYKNSLANFPNKKKGTVTETVFFVWGMTAFL